MPTRVGWEAIHNGGLASLTPVNPAGAQAGDTLLLVMTVDTASVSITDTAGWALLSDTTYNTRRTMVLWRKHAATYSALTLSAASGTGAIVMAVRADSGSILTAPVVGTRWDRPSHGGSINTTTMPSVNAVGDCSAIAVTAETSTGDETEAGVSIAGTGWAKWFYADTIVGVPVAVNYITAWRDAEDEATGDVVSTWPNNSNNSLGFQILIGQESAGPVETGQVGAHGCFNFGTDHLTIGSKRLAGSAHEAVISDASGEVDRATITHNGTTHWGSATFTDLDPGTEYTVTFEVDGVVQTDAEVVVSTLDLSAQSFKVVAGSCQFTGSTHPVFASMASKAPAWIAHMGDLHYEDATDEPTWRGGMESSLTGMQDFLQQVPMSWIPDNHDLIRTSPLGGGDQVGMAHWKYMAGSTGWASADSLGRAWRHGRVLAIHTDMRSARDNYQTVSEPRKMMGDTQKAWFKDLLSAAESDSSIALILWFTTWTARNDQNGRWNSYPTESSELEAHINSLPSVKRRMIMIGGDSHVLQADTGAREGVGFRFHEIPSLNVSGFNRSSIYSTGGWDLAEADLRTEAQSEADWGAYSLVTIDDNGAELRFRWEAVRVGPDGTEDVMSWWERSYGSPLVDARLGADQLTAVRMGDQTIWRPDARP